MVIMNYKMPSLTSNDPEEVSFARFAYNMRKKYRSGNLSKEHIQILEGISGWSWNIKTNIPITPYVSTYVPQDTDTDVQMATRIGEMFSRNGLSPIHFPETLHNFAGNRLTLFRKQHKEGILSKAIESILLNIPKSWTIWGEVSEEDIFHDDKFDSFLCHNKLPNDITYRIYMAQHLPKPWHGQYLKKKLDIIDSKIPGEIFNFESSLFDSRFIKMLRDYFSGETERRILSSMKTVGSIV